MGERLLASAESSCCVGTLEKLLPKTLDGLRGGQNGCKNGTYTRAAGSANDQFLRNKLDGASHGAETGNVCRAVKDLKSQLSTESEHLGNCPPGIAGSLADSEDEYRRLSLSGRIAIDGVQKRAVADVKMPVQVNHDNGEEKARNSQRASWGQLRQSAGAGVKMSAGGSDKTSRGYARRSWSKDPGAEKTASSGPQKRVTGQLNDHDETHGKVEAPGNDQDEQGNVESIVSNGIAMRPNGRIFQEQGTRMSGKSESIGTTSKANGSKAPATGGNYRWKMDKLAASLCFVPTSDTPAGQHANPRPQSFAARSVSDLDQESAELKPVEPWQNISDFPPPHGSRNLRHGQRAVESDSDFSAALS
jgi:hypothetical protein